jgi:myo-inositol-1(or 4)-monophosphatase
MQPVLNVAIAAARQAGEVILRYREMLERIQVTAKGPKDFYSEVDIKAEQMIINALSKAYPDHGFIAEESGIHHAQADSVWIIDPLDGTNNYLHAYPYFCVSIALKVKGKIECGVVFDPIHQECFAAARGYGARFNDRRLRVSSRATELNQALIGTNFPYHAPPSSFQERFHQLAQHTAGIRKTGAAALELSYVAAGRLDGFVGMSLRPWDIAAGAIIIQESGGMVSDLNGSDDFLKHGHVMAGSPKIFKHIAQGFLSTVE